MLTSLNLIFFTSSFLKKKQKFLCIFFERKVSLLKYKIFFFSKKGYFTLMRISQKRFLFSLSSRLKCVQDSITSFNKNEYYSNFKLDTEEKLLLVFSLKNLFFSNSLQSYIFMKYKGLSLSLNLPKIYNLSSEFLINNSILCALDFHSDKRCFGFKPFRDSSDIFFEIKNLFSKKLNAFLSFKIENIKKKSFFHQGWLLKNLCLERKVLFSWFNAQSYKFKRRRSFITECSYNDLYFTLVSFLLYGLFRN